MYSSFLFRLIFLRGPLFHVNSIIEALFNHTVLFRNVYPHPGFASTHALLLNLGVMSKGTSGNLSICYHGLYQPTSPYINLILVHFKEIMFNLLLLLMI